MGRCLNTPPINLAKVRVPEEILDLVPRDMAKSATSWCRSRVSDQETFRGDGRPDQRARGRRPEAPRPARDRADDRDRARGERRAQRRALGEREHERSAQAGFGRSRRRRRSAAAEARGDRSRPARDRQRRRAGHQDREPDPRAGDQGKGVRHSHRAFPADAEAALPHRWRIGRRGVAAESAPARDHLAHQDSRRPQHRGAARAAGRPVPDQGDGQGSRSSYFDSAHFARRESRHSYSR